MVVKNKILKALKETLPDATAEAMKEYFAAHEKLEKDFEKLESERDTLDSLWKQESEKVRVLNSYKDRLVEIEKKEIANADIERDLDIRTRVLSVREEFADIRVSDCKGMFETVFRNTTVRTEALKNTAIKTAGMVNYDNNGNPVQSDGGEVLQPNDENTVTTEE